MSTLNFQIGFKWPETPRNGSIWRPKEFKFCWGVGGDGVKVPGRPAGGKFYGEMPDKNYNFHLFCCNRRGANSYDLTEVTLYLPNGNEKTIESNSLVCKDDYSNTVDTFQGHVDGSWDNPMYWRLLDGDSQYVNSLGSGTLSIVISFSYQSNQYFVYANKVYMGEGPEAGTKPVQLASWP